MHGCGRPRGARARHGHGEGARRRDGRVRAGRRTSAASLVVISDRQLVGVAVLPRNQVLVIDGGSGPIGLCRDRQKIPGAAAHPAFRPGGDLRAGAVDWGREPPLRKLQICSNIIVCGFDSNGTLAKRREICASTGSASKRPCGPSPIPMRSLSWSASRTASNDGRPSAWWKGMSCWSWRIPTATRMKMVSSSR